MFSLILAENLLFFPDFPDMKKLSKFPLISLISGNPDVFTCVCHSVIGGGGLASQHASERVCMGGGVDRPPGCRPPSVTRKADGTHPTGMLSC